MTGNAQEALVRRKIAEDTEYAVRVFRTIWGRQQPSEQATGEYAGSDGGRGFQPHHTRPMNRIYKRLAARGWALYPHEADLLRTDMQRYAAQYLRAMQERGAEGAPVGPDRPPRGAVRGDAGAGGVTGLSTAAGVRRRPTRRGERRGDSDLDGLRGVFDQMTNEQRMAAINRMAERLGV